ncbi:MAG: hypothetical protein ACI8X5_000598 [Planctomycetota bacterium]|jgi:hypothetical protein
MLPFRLSQFGLGARLGLSAMILVLLGGLVVSSLHLTSHHENRDEQDGMSFDDVVGHYHGIQTEAPLRRALESGHPETLGTEQRKVLLAWLSGDRISEDYDSLDLGDDAPVEILDVSCLNCHSASAQEGGGIGKTIPLEYFDEVKKLAFSRDVSPVGEKILMASLHTHSLGMGTLSLILALLALATRFPSKLVGALTAASGLGLFVDLSSWLLARGDVSFVKLIVAGGGIWMISTVLLGLLALIELWLPRGAAAEE